jgi:hypothetical protein
MQLSQLEEQAIAGMLSARHDSVDQASHRKTCQKTCALALEVQIRPECSLSQKSQIISDKMASIRQNYD